MLRNASPLAFPKSMVMSLVRRRLGRGLARFSAVGFAVELDSFDGALVGVSMALVRFFGGLKGLDEECLR